MNTNELMKQTCNVFLRRLDLYPKGVKGSIISEPQNELIRVKKFPQILKEKATSRGSQSVDLEWRTKDGVESALCSIMLELLQSKTLSVPSFDYY